jgi:glycine oxidase
MSTPSLKGARWIVAGAGVLGASIAWKLAQTGADVVLCDPAAAGDNASGIAAGMLAPAMEAALDPETGLAFAQLAAARDLWSAFAQDAGISLDRSGAMLVSPEAERIAATLSAIGAAHRSLNGDEAAALSDGLTRAHPAVLTLEDWRLDAPMALGRLIVAAREAGAKIVLAAVTGFDGGRVTLSNGETFAVDGLVAATGWGAATAWGAALAPELALLGPIKGQILRSTAGPTRGPVVRGAGVYIAPAPQGAIIGATMQAGVSDRQIEPGVVQELLRKASALYPVLAEAAFTPSAAVRAASPDGLPLVGSSRKSGVLLAAGARRNGWLLAPLIAGDIVRLAAGDGAQTPAFDPARFAA